MIRGLGPALGLAVAIVAFTGSSAGAATLRFTDAEGDSQAPRQDIVGARIDNRDRAIVARVAFARDFRGDVIVSVDPRRAEGVRLVASVTSRGREAYVISGSFNDPRPAGDAITCDGFRVRWSSTLRVVTMRLPSRCLRHGNYGAIRTAVLTEAGGGDSDWAPGSTTAGDRTSRWITRG